MTRLLRPWRDPAFRILALALTVACLSITAVLMLRSELQLRFDQRSAQVLGGHTVLEGTRLPDDSQRMLLANSANAERLRFRSVVIHGGEFLLVGVKAVSDGWPLFGTVLVADSRFAEARTKSRGPAPGEVWVADQVLDRLRLSVGETLTVGERAFPITAALKQEPDQSGGFYSMSPRVLMHIDDVASTGVLGQGTRYRHELLLAKAPAADLVERLEKTLRPDQEIESVEDNAGGTLGPLRQLTLWISLSVLLVTLLCGAATWLASGVRTRRRARQVALMRTFGASRRQVLIRLLSEDILAVLPLLALASSTGVVAVLVLRQVLDWQGPLAAGPADWIAMALVPVLLLTAYVLPRLYALVSTPAATVLRQSQGGSGRAGLALAAALLAPVLIAALMTGSLQDLLLTLLVLCLLAAGLPLLLWPLLRGLDRSGEALSLPVRLAIRRLSRRPMLSLPLVASLMLATAVLTLSLLTGNELLGKWRQQLPEKAPNFFVLNLFDRDLDALSDWQSAHGARAEPLYKIARARLTHINAVPVKDAVTKENDRASRALNRDLALTEGVALPESNRLTQGEWLQPGDGGVSVESELAEALGVTLGDTLTFVGARAPFSAQVTSIRDVDWESFAPNFYFMFSANALDEQDVTWLTSFFLPAGDGARLAALMRELPHLTLLDVNALLDQAEDIIAQASLATLVLAALLTLASLLVMLAALLASQQQRAVDQALLTTLGAAEAVINRIDRLEFALLATLAAGGGLLVVLACLAPLGLLLFDGALPLSLWLLLLPALGLLIWLVGSRGARPRHRTPPLALLGGAQ